MRLVWLLCVLVAPGIALAAPLEAGVAVIDITPAGFCIQELGPGVDFEYVRERTGAPLLPKE